MKTTATNRKIRELLTSLREGRLIPRPDFQRRLVWSNKDKSSFLETVLMNYPFPEVYVAAGNVDVETGVGTELLVDGQQRLTTLQQYFNNSLDLVLTKGIIPYSELSKDQKEAFLQYDVVVRDLGNVSLEIIRSVFQKINATKYALNAMEVHNSRYEGEFKQFADEFAQRSFFDSHRIFSASEIKRMQDTRFVAVLAATALETYFNRDDEVEEYLKRYNDEFPLRYELEREFDQVIDIIEAMKFSQNSRIWKKADFFTIFIELHRAKFKKVLEFDPSSLKVLLSDFYLQVDDPANRADPESHVSKYYKAALQATNDRVSRLIRGEIVAKIILGLSEDTIPIPA